MRFNSRLQKSVAFGIGLLVATATARAQSNVDLRAPIAPLLFQQPPNQEISISSDLFDVWDSSKNPQIKSLIDRSFEMIYSTRAAQKTLLSDSFFLETIVANAAFGVGLGNHSNEAFKLEHDLGVPFEFTARLIEANGGQKQTRPIAYGSAQGDYQVHSKRYFFLKSKTGQAHKFESFTQKDNATIVFVEPETLDRLALIKILAHEVAITGDQKSKLSDIVFSTNDEVYGEKRAREKTPRALAYESVNAVFGVVRALVFERDVLKQIFPNQIFSANAVEESLYSEKMKNETFCKKIVSDFAGELARINYVSQDTPQEIANLFKKSSTIEIRGLKTPICQFATTPFVRWHGYKTDGPRPRIGDWNGKTQEKQRQADPDQALKHLKPTENTDLENPLLKQRFMKDGVDVKDKAYIPHLSLQYSDIRGVPTKMTVPERWSFSTK